MLLLLLHILMGPSVIEAIKSWVHDGKQYLYCNATFNQNNPFDFALAENLKIFQQYLELLLPNKRQPCRNRVSNVQKKIVINPFLGLGLVHVCHYCP
jgi:hypothetical protein